MHRAEAIALLEAHHTFPTDHRFFAIVRAEPPAVEGVLASVAALCGLGDLGDRVERVPSSGGRWVSLRMTLPCPTATHVLDIYAHLQSLPQIVRVL